LPILATIQGQEIKRKGIQKYIGRLKEYGRIERRHSSFISAYMVKVGSILQNIEISPFNEIKSQ